MPVIRLAHALKGKGIVGVKTLNLCDEVGFQSFDAYLCFYFSLNRALFR